VNFSYNIFIVCRRECTTVHTVFSQIKTLKEISYISLLSSTVQTVKKLIVINSLTVWTQLAYLFN